MEILIPYFAINVGQSNPSHYAAMYGGFNCMWIKALSYEQLGEGRAAENITALELYWLIEMKNVLGALLKPGCLSMVPKIDKRQTLETIQETFDAVKDLLELRDLL